MICIQTRTTMHLRSPPSLLFFATLLCLSGVRGTLERRPPEFSQMSQMKLPSYIQDDAAGAISEDGIGEDFLKRTLEGGPPDLPDETSKYRSSPDGKMTLHIHLKEPMHNITYNQRSKVTFMCDIVGEPMPNFTWFQGDKPITKDWKNFRIIKELWGSTLRILKPTFKDAGDYTCVGENTSGRRSTTASFIFQDNTKLPSRPKWPTIDQTHKPTPDKGFCQIFKSNVCVRYLKGHQVYVSTVLHQTLLEQQISNFIAKATDQTWSPEDEECLGRIMEAICYYNFPLCPTPRETDGSRHPTASSSTSASSHSVVTPKRLCHEDCYLATQGECSKTYRRLMNLQNQESVPKLVMDCTNLPAFNAFEPNACLRTGYRPPVPDLTDLVSKPHSVSGKAPSMPGDSAQNSLRLSITELPQPDAANQKPDLLPVFISFGVLSFVTLLLITICVLCRRSGHSGYSNDMFGGSSGNSQSNRLGMQSLCGKKRMAVNNHQMELTSPKNAALSKTTAPNYNHQEMTPFVGATSFADPITLVNTSEVVKESTASTASGSSGLTSGQQGYHQYQTPPYSKVLMPPPCSPPPPPPLTNEMANHRAFAPMCPMDGAAEDHLQLSRQNQAAAVAAAATQFAMANSLIDNLVASDNQGFRAINFPMSQIKFGERIGQGVFGPVYAGELLASSDYENSKSTKVVIKTLSPGAPAAMQTDFRREVNIMSELNHPNLLGIFGVSFQQPPWCMLFEVTPYGDLHETLVASRRLSENDWSATGQAGGLTDSDRFQIASQIASGMEYLSSNRLIHRDLAARNVTVGEHLLCKITDLGLARDCYAMDYYLVPAANNLLLPIRWMPIDAIQYGRFTVESDIWAFGVVLWEIWTDGMRPYHMYCDADVIDLIQSRYLLPYPSRCPPNVYALMLDCWKEVCSKRPSFGEILSQLSSLKHEIPCIPQQPFARGGLFHNSFPPQLTMDVGPNSCSQSGDSGKTNSTEMSTDRPVSQRISSVPMPIMGMTEVQKRHSKGNDQIIDQLTTSCDQLMNTSGQHNRSSSISDQFNMLGPRPVTTGANCSSGKNSSINFFSPSPPLYTSEATRVI